MTNYAIGELVGHVHALKKLEDFDWVGNDIIKIVIDDLIKKDSWGTGLGLVGFVGVGKTHLLASLYKERMWRTINENGQLPIWLNFSDLYDLEHSELVEVIGRGNIIFIDDLFCMGYKEKEIDIVKEIVFRCYNSNKILCFSSNLFVENWDIDLRVRDRLKEMCRVFEIVGDSHRRQI